MTTTAHRGSSIARASAAGRAACALSYPNSTSSSYVYNATTGSLDRISHTYGGTDFERLSYTHDVTGMVNSIERLGVEPLMPGVFNATHDSANRVKRFGPQSLVHDKNGNPTQRGETTYSWNQKNQLTGVTNSTGTFVTYMYDALDRRVAKLTNTTTTQYLYDGLNIVAELDENNNVNAWYVMGLGLDQPLARIENSGAVHYYHSDILGSIVALTDGSGTVTTRYNYSPFGETVVIGTDVANPFRFVAKYHDDETGMIIFPYRYYDARMGRFISEDPIRFTSGEINWYVYALNNPVNNTDPLGLKVYKCCRNIQVNPTLNTLASLLGVQHCFIKTDSTEAGMGPANGEPLPVSPYGEPTKIVAHTGQSAFSTCIEIKDIDENCVNQELLIGKGTGEWTETNNCNTFVSRVLAKCSTKNEICKFGLGGWQ